MENYQRSPLSHKIFGYGPDTFGIITGYNYYGDMVSRYGERFESAHDEYLQRLITVRVAGLVNYIGLLSASTQKILRDAKKEPAVITIVSVLACYGAQAFVGISVPMVAPVVLTLMMIGLSVVQGTRSHLPRDIVTGGLSRCYTGQDA